MATLLLSGVSAAEINESMDRPKRSIPDRIKKVVVHPLFDAVNIILEDADPCKVQLKITTKKNSCKKG